MKVILDTNVLISALLTPGGNANEVYLAWRGKRFELLTAADQIDELRRVSRYPHLRPFLTVSRVGELVNNMRNATVLARLPPLPAEWASNDPDDDFLVTLALAGEADWLVTGDRRAGLLARGSVGNTRIATLAQFAKELVA